MTRNGPKRHSAIPRDCLISLASLLSLRIGEDFTRTRDQLQRSPKALAVGAVLARWRDRHRYCCDGDEHYAPGTYAMNGRCVGPLSNGKPRRS